ncbi:hypothetical protein Bca52824_075921 [Brassica carinata]|uniref:Uncharacterized protein n=1 Tax=Brassica carinata TaxID=52824 RepID=A0A8X7PT23_BRACI|nr:hypothetical protein Bca52824_075921 [Brassica carinata]
MPQNVSAIMRLDCADPVFNVMPHREELLRIRRSQKLLKSWQFKFKFMSHTLTLPGNITFLRKQGDPKDKLLYVWHPWKNKEKMMKSETFCSNVRAKHVMGLKKADQQIILDDFNKYGPGWVYSKQRCVNEGAALGRGAATSGFNKFIELTEAAKDLKDGSLSQ